MKNNSITHPIIVALTAFAYISLTGCAVQNIEGSLPYITIAAATGTEIAMRKQSSRTKADVYNISAALRSLATGEVPTVPAVNKAIASFTTDPEAALIGKIVADTYARYYSKLSGNGKIAADLLEALAQGVENGASK